MSIYFLLVMQALLALVAAAFVFYFGYIFWTMRHAIPYVPTPYSVIRVMIAAARIQQTDRVIDLGAGTGRIVIDVARHYPVFAIGVEQSFLLRCAARLRSFFTVKKGTVLFVNADLFTYPLSGVTVVFCFLTTNALERLTQNVITLPKDARIISHKFRLPSSSDWEESIIPIGKRTTVYVYKKIV